MRNAHALRRDLAWIAGLALLALVGLHMDGPETPSEIAAARPAPASPARRTPVVDVVERVSPAVVNISTDRVVSSSPFHRRSGDPFGFFREFFEQPRRQVVPNSLGSGVIVRPEGYVLTNYHVLVHADAVRVTMADGTQHEAEPLGADPSSDLAVLRIEGDGPFPSAPLGSSSDLMIGETAIAIGNPFGLSHTVTTGVISALNRSVRSMDDTVYTDFIQTDASINPGNSGGPLLNLEGEVVGVNTAIRADAEGIGFAIPADRIRRVLEDLIAYGAVRPTWLGLEVWDLTPQLASRLGVDPGGIVVRRVHHGSPAENAGVAAGDRILAVGDAKVNTRSDWRTLLSRYAPGDRFTLRVRGPGGDRDLEVRLEALGRGRVLDLARARTGLVLEEPSRAERQRGLPEDVLVVREVVDGGPAARIGLVPGDVITRLDGERVRNLEEFVEGFGRVWEREAIMLRVARRGNFYRIILEMD